MPKIDEIMQQALGLELQERAALAEKLLASLDLLSEEEADQLWAQEAERRLNEYREGRGKSVSSAAVRKKAERLLR